jgi:integrase
MPEFYAKLVQVETMPSNALQFTILTNLRTSEVLKARAEQFDLNKLIWNVPAPQMKTKKPHQVPLSDTAAELVESVMRSHNAPFIFHGRNPEKTLSNMAMLSLIKRNLKEFDTTVHGLRATFRIWGSEQTSHDFGAMEFALAHQQDKVSAAYNRTTLLELRRPLMQDWACYVTGRDHPGQLVPNRLN